MDLQPHPETRYQDSKTLITFEDQLEVEALHRLSLGGNELKLALYSLYLYKPSFEFPLHVAVHNVTLMKEMTWMGRRLMEGKAKTSVDTALYDQIGDYVLGRFAIVKADDVPTQITNEHPGQAHS